MAAPKTMLETTFFLENIRLGKKLLTDSPQNTTMSYNHIEISYILCRIRKMKKNMHVRRKNVDFHMYLLALYF